MLADAITEHKITPDQREILSAMPYRDSREPESGKQIMINNSGMNHLIEIQSSGVPIYHRDGWLDAAPRDILIAYKNLGNPQKIIIGPWSHFDSTELELIEHLRWFDYWLKGIDNGIMDEAPIYYYTMGLGNKTGWHEAWQWPLPDEQRTNYYFSGGPSRSVKSVNDGKLSLIAPENATRFDKYSVDYSTSSGEETRISYYDIVYNTDQAPNDAKGLTYTTPPLASDVEVTGHPVIHLWITSTAKDGDFFAYLEDVDASNNSHYVTQGQLRASHRAVSTASFDYLGLPYHRSYAADASDLPKEPVELLFDLQPTSYIFGAGHRIRLTITCADQHNFLTPQLNPPPTVTLYWDAKHPSYIDLPVIPGK